MKQFKKDLTGIINEHSLENEFNLPDFLIAEYLVDCLLAYKKVRDLEQPREESVTKS